MTTEDLRHSFEAWHAGTADDMLSSTLTTQALIPADKLRDYIAYARARCHPELTEPAAAKLVDSYLNLRGVGTSRKASPA